MNYACLFLSLPHLTTLDLCTDIRFLERPQLLTLC
jgi:hypothetical protein